MNLFYKIYFLDQDGKISSHYEVSELIIAENMAMNYIQICRQTNYQGKVIITKEEIIKEYK